MKIMGAKISYIVAVYNVGDWIERCARSLFEQTMEEIEIIFVNDASPDDSIEIIRKTLEDYPQRKGQVKIVSHEKNEGTPNTRRDGLKAATGKYINFIDGDDYVEPEMAALMYEKAEETGADMVVSDVFFHRQDEVWIMTQVPNGIEGNGENVRDDTINRMVSPGIWSKLIRRSLFEEHRIEWPVCSMAEDLVLCCEAVYYAQKIVHVPVPLYHYNAYNPHSTTNRRNAKHREERQRQFVQNNNVLFGFLEREGVAEKYALGILVDKVMAKNEILPYTNKWKYRKLWLRTYPEVNRKLLFGDKRHKSTYREKIWLLVICLGLFPRMRKRLISKRLKSAEVWRRGEY